MYTPWGLKIQNDYQAHHHHHRGQNRPHQKTFIHPQGPPRASLTRQKASWWE